MAPLYNALFDAVAARKPAAFVAEYAWSTSGCGEPCPDAPLGFDELMSLGGDVLEAETTSAEQRAPEPGPEAELERRRFEEHLAGLAPAARPAARREHARARREIARRRALMTRQTYILSRLHHRYSALTLPRDVDLGPAPSPLRGGVGIPAGTRGELPAMPSPAEENQLQVRFVALRRWIGPIECGEPRRFRWGKPWPSEVRASRAVPLATDLTRAPRDRKLLESVLDAPVAELGISPPEPAPKKADSQAMAAGQPSVARPAKGAGGAGCALSPAREKGEPLFWLAWLSAALLARCGLRSNRARGARRPARGIPWPT